jgi:hypothetical protein
MNGRFDGDGDRDGDEDARMLYTVLGECLAARPDAVAVIRDEALDHTKYLVKTDEPIKVGHGLDHITAMLDREVTFATAVQLTILDRVHYTDGAALFRILGDVEPAFRALRAMQDGTGDRAEFAAARKNASAALARTQEQLRRST